MLKDEGNDVWDNDDDGGNDTKVMMIGKKWKTKVMMMKETMTNMTVKKVMVTNDGDKVNVQW